MHTHAHKFMHARTRIDTSCSTDGMKSRQIDALGGTALLSFLKVGELVHGEMDALVNYSFH